MTITTTTLTRTAAVSAAAAGLLFLGVQIKHPHLDATFVTTTEWLVRETAKILMAVFSLVGITGMYLRQVRQAGVLGLIGYAVFGLGYLAILCVQAVAVCVLPVVARTEPGYVNDVLAVATGGKATGDIALMQTLCQFMGLTFLGGGLIFGIALFRTRVLSRWASVLLAFGSLATAAIPLLPQINQRLFAVPTGIAMVGLGYSLWRTQGGAGAAPLASDGTAHLDPASAR